MNKTVINPWKWQDQLGFVQGIEISSAERILFCSGQTSVDEEGRPVHVGNMAAQMNKALDNIETVLFQAGFKLSDIVQFKYYTTDIVAFSEGAKELLARMIKKDCKPSSTLLGITALFHPDIMVEMEAIAVK